MKTTEDLDLMTDPEYMDAITKEAMRGDDALWELLISPEHVDRTYKIIKDLLTSLDDQLHIANEFQGGGDPEWRHRVVLFRRRLFPYRSEAKKVVEDLDRQEVEEGWRGVALKLADALRESPVLETVTAPRSKLCLADWIERREAA